MRDARAEEACRAEAHGGQWRRQGLQKRRGNGEGSGARCAACSAYAAPPQGCRATGDSLGTHAACHVPVRHCNARLGHYYAGAGDAPPVARVHTRRSGRGARRRRGAGVPKMMLRGSRMRSVGMHARMAPARARIASGAVNGNFGGGQRRAEAVAQRFLAAMGTCTLAAAGTGAAASGRVGECRRACLAVGLQLRRS